MEHINFDLCLYFDIICSSETNLHNNRIIDFDLDLPGFQKSIRRDRIDRQWSGAMVYVSDSLGAIRRPKYEIENLEAIWLQINCPNNKKFLLRREGVSGVN